jgi:hypothetical protein
MQEAQAYEYTANQIRQLKFLLFSGMIDGLAYVHGKARILDHYLRATDRSRIALTFNSLQRVQSFSPLLDWHEIGEEKQRICEVRCTSN